LKSTNIAINKHIKKTTMKATNISIKQQSSVSINVETLQEIKQHLWLRVKGAWFRVLGSRFRVHSLLFTLHSSLIRLYRQELRLTRTVAVWCDRHNALMNWLMAIQVMVFAFYVFMFA
jgi:hypothetical protein